MINPLGKTIFRMFVLQMIPLEPEKQLLSMGECMNWGGVTKQIVFVPLFFENFAYGKIDERSFSNPHPGWYNVTTTKITI